MGRGVRASGGGSTADNVVVSFAAAFLGEAQGWGSVGRGFDFLSRGVPFFVINGRLAGW